MIPRYSRPEMSAVWTEENKFNSYLKVEIEAAAAWSKLGVIPEHDVELLRQNARFDIQRIYEIEKETKHDIVAFTRTVSESLGEEKKWVHYGMTSTDVVDTANGYLLKQANKILREDLQRMSAILKKRAYEFKDTPCIGRTHGVHADITSLGLKWALWFEEAIAVEPNCVEAHCNRGVCFECTGRLEEAREAYNTALKILPNYEPAVVGLNRLDKMK